MSTPISTLTPESLTKQLLTAGPNLQDLIQHFGEQARIIAQTLHSQDFTHHLQLQIDLATTHAKLQAATLLPACMAKLHELTQSEKPEVARRATVSILAIAGLATTAKPAAPTPAPSPTPPPAPAPASSSSSSPSSPPPSSPRPSAIKPPTRPQPQSKPLTTQEIIVADRHIDDILNFHFDLYFTHGIDLQAIDQHHFPGFTDHLKSFFKPLGITICDHDPNFAKNSLENKDLVTAAHAYLRHLDTQNPLRCPLTISRTGPQTQNAQPIALNAKLNQNPNESALLTATPAPLATAP